jgi:hypothetical protein
MLRLRLQDSGVRGGRCATNVASKAFLGLTSEARLGLDTTADPKIRINDDGSVTSRLATART